MELDGKLVRMENGSWARYRSVPLQAGSGVRVVVAVEVAPEERERLERESQRATVS